MLNDKKNILVTTHEHPDPDALAACIGLSALLTSQLPQAKVSVSFKGQVGGGLNEMFAQQSDARRLVWDEAALPTFDAIILVDAQPAFSHVPLPPTIIPTAVIDHHPSPRGRRPKCDFCDIRGDVGASASIIFSYFMEMEVPISRDLGALLLFAIESDLAGAAGQPGELDNMALSSLTLIADPRKLYKMRYADLPQNYYIAYFNGLNNAVIYDHALISHLDTIDSPEKPAVVADFLLRAEPVQWALVTAVNGDELAMSLRTYNPKLSAGELMRRLVRKLGNGGGHRTKAGGGIPLENGSSTEIERLRKILRRRYLRALGIKMSRGQRLVPKPETK